jgi:hypothetical protein
VEPADYMKHRRYTSGRFSKDHYYQHPDEYVSCFHYKACLSDQYFLLAMLVLHVVRCPLGQYKDMSVGLR